MGWGSTRRAILHSRWVSSRRRKGGDWRKKGGDWGQISRNQCGIRVQPAGYQGHVSTNYNASVSANARAQSQIQGAILTKMELRSQQQWMWPWNRVLARWLRVNAAPSSVVFLGRVGRDDLGWVESAECRYEAANKRLGLEWSRFTWDCRNGRGQIPTCCLQGIELGLRSTTSSWEDWLSDGMPEGVNGLPSGSQKVPRARNCCQTPSARIKVEFDCMVRPQAVANGDKEPGRGQQWLAWDYKFDAEASRVS